MAITNFSPLQLNSILTVGVDDTGHDVKFFGATSGRYLLWDESEDQLLFRDSTKAAFGNSNDLEIYHQNGTGNIITSNTSDIKFIQNFNDGDILFSSDDGSGGIATYLQIDGGEGYTLANKHIRFKDDAEARFGTGSDMAVYHDGSNSFMRNDTGNLTISNTTDDGDIIFQSDDGSGGNATYLTLDGSAGHTVASKEIQFLDSVVARFGTGNDFKIHHDGTNTLLVNDTGSIFIDNYADNAYTYFRNDNGAGSIATYFFLDGSAAVHDGSATTHLFTTWGDNSRIAVGTGKDFQMTHNGTNTFLSNNTGDLTIQNNTDDKDIILSCDDGSGGTAAYLTLDGSSGYTKAHKHILYEDNAKAMFGTGGDMQILHDGSNSYISQNVTGALYIENNATDGDVILRSDDGSGGTATYLTLDGSAGTVEVAKPTNFAGKVTISDNQYLSWSTNSRIVANSSYMQFQVAATDKMRILADGNVGIGTTSPASLLHVAGTVQVGVDDTGHDVKFFGATSGSFLLWDESDDSLNLTDDTKLKFGDSNDMNIFHDGSNTFIQNNVGHLRIKNNANNKDIVLQTDDGNGSVQTYLTLDGGEETLVASVPLVLEADSTVGWHGSVTRVKILPSDFQPDSGGRPVMISLGTNEAHLFSNGSGKMFASIPIPTGFKATHVKIHGSDTGQNFSVHEANIANKTTVEKGSSTPIEDEVGITEVESTTTNYILIIVESDGTTDEIHGGYMTIAKI